MNRGRIGWRLRTRLPPLFLFLFSLFGRPPAAGAQPLVYPATPREEVSDEFQGNVVEDPYRWLENLEAPQTRAWVKGQNRLTSGYLFKVAAAYERIVPEVAASPAWKQ